MNYSVLISGIAAATLLAGGASATVHQRLHHSRSMGSAAEVYAAPAQPIPYAQLDNYLHATPSQRESLSMASGSTSQSSGSQAAAPQGATPNGDMTSSATPSPGTGDQMSGASPGGAGTMSPSEDQGKMGQSPVNPPAPPADGSTPPK